MTVMLFFNHRVNACGVYQYGLRVATILGANYVEIETYDDYVRALEQNAQDLKAVIFNYHESTMPWLTRENIQRHVKNFGILHECDNKVGFDFVINIDPNTPVTWDEFPIPRPLHVDDLDYIPNDPEVRDFIEAHGSTGVPVFGSFGFSINTKGFPKVVQMVNDQYDDAIVKFLIPKAYYGPTPDEIVNQINSVPTKPGVKVMVLTRFVANEDVLCFLRSNTMNIFLYDSLPGRGISSVIDYALSVPVPIGISDSYMFRNIYSDDICLYKRSINDVLRNGNACLDKFRDAWHPHRLHHTFREAIVARCGGT